jgi:hypothetical protein
MGPPTGIEAWVTFLLCVWANRATCRHLVSCAAGQSLVASFHLVNGYLQVLAGITVDAM